MWNLKINYTNELTKQKRLTELENKLLVTRGKGIVRGVGQVIYILLYSKQITNKDLLYSIWNSTQCYVPAWMGRWSGGEWIYVYVQLSPFTVQLKRSQNC